MANIQGSGRVLIGCETSGEVRRAFPMPDNLAYAVFISTATRRDYVDYCRETEGF